MGIKTVNPTTAKVINTYSTMSQAEIDKIIAATHKAFLIWREFRFEERAAYLQKVAHLLKKRKLEYAKLMATEMGKPLAQGEAEIEKCALTCLHYAEHAKDYLQTREVKTEAHKSLVSFQPLGVVFAIMPWNFPFWQVFRFAAPTLMAGNGALLKHAPISTGTALAIQELFTEAGSLENIFRTLIIPDGQARYVINHPKVVAVTLTGSTRAGSEVASIASHALKKTVLELGGSDPYLILEDADLEQAAETCVNSRMSNSGQSCIAAKRLITAKAVHDKFIELLKEKIKKYKMGDPQQKDVNFGPLARRDLRDKLHDQVQKSIKEGAKLIVGGSVPDLPGFFYPPTILTDIKKGMPAYEEELFGPVLSVLTAKDEDEAIEIANDTSYGLGACVFTKDLARGEKIALEKLQAGTCNVNLLVASDPRLPFGGIKHSGYGRELAIEGIRAFVNVKTTSIAK